MTSLVSSAARNAAVSAASAAANGLKNNAYLTSLQTSIGSGYKRRLIRDGVQVWSGIATGTLPISGSSFLLPSTVTSETMAAADIDTGTWVHRIEKATDPNVFIQTDVGRAGSGKPAILSSDLTSGGTLTMGDFRLLSPPFDSPTTYPEPASSGVAAPLGQSESNWTRTFTEEFAGALDSAKWPRTQMWYGGEVPSTAGPYVGLPDGTINYDVNSGGNSLLRIWPQLGTTSGKFFERALNTDGSGLSGGFAQKFGFWEARVKMPRGKGCWPAFWLLNHTEANWPTGVVPPAWRPEVDIFEAYPGGGSASWWSTDDWQPTTWAPSFWTDNDSRATGAEAFEYRTKSGPFMHNMHVSKGHLLNQAFHVYGMKWEAGGKFTWYYDGVALGSTTFTAHSTNIDNNPLFLIISMGYGSASGHATPWDTPQGSSNSLEVDYIRVWSASSTAPTLTAYDPLDGSNTATTPTTVSDNDSRWVWNINPKKKFSEITNYLAGRQVTNLRPMAIHEPGAAPVNDGVNQILDRKLNPNGDGDMVFWHEIRSNLAKGSTYYADTWRSEITQDSSMNRPDVCYWETDYWGAIGYYMTPDLVMAPSLSIYDAHTHFDDGPIKPSPMNGFVSDTGLKFIIRYRTTVSTSSTDTARTEVTVWHDTAPTLNEWHYYIWKFRVQPDNGGYWHIWRKVGKTGQLTKVGEYNGPIGYVSGGDFSSYRPICYQKSGLYNFRATWSGPAARLMYSKGMRVLHADPGTPEITEKVMLALIDPDPNTNVPGEDPPPPPPPPPPTEAEFRTKWVVKDPKRWSAKGTATTGSAPSIVSTSLPAATLGVAYSANLAATGTEPITWSLQGNLPPGLTLNTVTKQITGTPTTTGNYNFTLIATNPYGTDSKLASLSVQENASFAPPNISSAAMPTGTVGTAYSVQIGVSGAAPITFTLYGGKLPAGLSLSSGGIVSGTPTEAVVEQFIVEASNAHGSSRRTLSITISANTAGSEPSAWGRAFRRN